MQVSERLFPGRLFGWFRFEAMRKDGIVCWNIEAVVVEALTVTAVCAALLRIRSLRSSTFQGNRNA
jgi:hypothetical protein